MTNDRLYTRDEVAAAVNAAADEIGPDEDAYEDEDTIRQQDVANLFVNLVMGFLEDPGKDADDIIREAYGTDPDTVREWVE